MSVPCLCVDSMREREREREREEDWGGGRERGKREVPKTYTYMHAFRDIHCTQTYLFA